MTDTGNLPNDAYRLVVQSVPVLCVDIIPRFADSPDRPYLLIARQTPDGRRWCWIGGRVRLDERLGDAVSRHLRATLGARVSLRARDWSSPDLVVEFAREAQPKRAHDPRKHAISLAWVVDCDGRPEPAGEAQAVECFGPEALPPDEEFGFGLGPSARGLIRADAERRTLPNGQSVPDGL